MPSGLRARAAPRAAALLALGLLASPEAGAIGSQRRTLVKLTVAELQELRPGAREKLRRAVRDDGAVLLEGTPGLASATDAALEGLAECFDAVAGGVREGRQDGPKSLDLSNGAARTTMATQTLQGLPEALPGWVQEECPGLAPLVTNLRLLTSMVLPLFARAVDRATAENATGTVPTPNFLSAPAPRPPAPTALEDLVRRGKLLEHFHRYAQLRSPDEPRGAGEHRALQMHTDMGMLQALAVRWRRTAAAGRGQIRGPPERDHFVGLEVELPSGAIVETDASVAGGGAEAAGSGLLLLVGQGTEDWMPHLQLRAAPHALSLAGTSGWERLVFAVMVLPPEDWHIDGPDGDVPFGEWWRRATDAVLSGPGDASDEEDAWAVGSMSRAALHRRLGGAANSCAAGQVFCWMQCRAIPDTCVDHTKAMCWLEDEQRPCSEHCNSKCAVACPEQNDGFLEVKDSGETKCNGRYVKYVDAEASKNAQTLADTEKLLDEADEILKKAAQQAQEAAQQAQEQQQPVIVEVPEEPVEFKKIQDSAWNLNKVCGAFGKASRLPRTAMREIESRFNVEERQEPTPQDARPGNAEKVLALRKQLADCQAIVAAPIYQLDLQRKESTGKNAWVTEACKITLSGDGDEWLLEWWRKDEEKQEEDLPVEEKVLYRSLQYSTQFPVGVSGLWSVVEGSWPPPSMNYPTGTVASNPVETEAFCNADVTTDMHMMGFVWSFGGVSEPCLVYFFRGLELTSAMKFWMAVACTVGAGIFTEWLVAARRAECVKGAPLKLILYATTRTSGYLVMLISMMYSFEMFIALILGLTIGHALFNMEAPPGEDATPCCAAGDGKKVAKAAATAKEAPPGEDATPCCAAGDGKKMATAKAAATAKDSGTPLLDKDRNKDEEVVVEMTKLQPAHIRLKVEGMTCGKCETTVRNAAKEVDAVRAVREVSHKECLLVVEVRDGGEDAAIAERVCRKLSEVGFVASHIVPGRPSVQSLPSVLSVRSEVSQAEAVTKRR